VAASELSASKINGKLDEHSSKLDNLQSAINKIADMISRFGIQEPESNAKVTDTYEETGTVKDTNLLFNARGSHGEVDVPQ